MDTLRDEIAGKIAELAEIEPKEVEDDKPLRDLGVDSLMAIEIVVFVEKKIRREFPEDRIPKIQTLRDILREVESLNGTGSS